jgi:hypothetical protein
MLSPVPKIDLTDASIREQLLGNPVVNYKAFLAVLLLCSQTLSVLPSHLLNMLLTTNGADLHPQVRGVLEFTRQEMLNTNR